MRNADWQQLAVSMSNATIIKHSMPGSMLDECLLRKTCDGALSLWWSMVLSATVTCVSACTEDEEGKVEDADEKKEKKKKTVKEVQHEWNLLNKQVCGWFSAPHVCNLCRELVLQWHDLHWATEPSSACLLALLSLNSYSRSCTRALSPAQCSSAKPVSCPCCPCTMLQPSLCRTLVSPW